MALNKKKPEQAKRTQTPLVSGVSLPETRLEFDPVVPVGRLKVGEDAGVVPAVRRYDEVSDEALEASIRKFGFVEPIIAARDGRILHGAHRYAIAQKLQQRTVPVMWVDNWEHDDAETQFYNVYANKINDWSSWIAENVDEVLRSVDGGVKKKVMEGDDSTFVVVPDETGEYRDMAGKLGMFIDVIPKKLCASSATLLTLAQLRIKSLGRRYQYNDEQLLYIETLRDAVDYHRKKVVEEGLNSAGNLEQKLSQESTWDAKIMSDGRIVARIVFLHSVGLPNDEISEIVGVPVSNKALRERAKAQGMDSFVEMPTVENALWRSAKRSFNPEDTYGWWITQLLETRADMLADKDVAAVLGELEQYRRPWSGATAVEDGPMPPVTRLDYSEPKAARLRKKAVGLILEKTADQLDGNGDRVVDEGMAEDWVDWPEALRFYAQECFQHALDEEARKHPAKKGRKSPMDVATTRQSTDKLCGKKEWQEMVWLDLVNSDTAKYDAMDEDAAAEAEKTAYATAGMEYDQTTTQEFNDRLMSLREKYSAGPLKGIFAMLQGPSHDGDLSSDPDSKKAGK